MTDIIEELTAEAVRYRLAWKSARRRAKQYDDLVDSVDDTWQQRCDELSDLVRQHLAERDEARQLLHDQVDRLLTALIERDLARAEVQQWQDDASQVLQEREEARAQVVRLGKENEDLRRAIRNLSEAYHASVVDAATDRLRAALDEERIEPKAIDLERFDSGAYTAPAEERIELGWWCRVHLATVGTCDVSNGIPCAASYGRTEGEAG